MGVEIKKREYTSIFRPQDTGINWLIGNTGEWQKLTIDAEFGVFIEFDTTNSLFIDDPDTLTITNGKSWNEYGFSEGDSVVLQWIHRDTSNPSAPVDNYNRVPFPGDVMKIGRIEDNKAYFVDGTSLQPIAGFGAWSQIMPVNSADFNIVDVSVFTEKKPQGIKFKYGHLENSESASNNLSSFIDGTMTEFLLENTDDLAIMPIGLPRNMEPLGNQSGMSIAYVKCTYLGPTYYNIKHVYEIELVFMLSSFFENITNLEDRVAPGEVFDAASLTDNFEIIGMPVYNNPNIEIKNDMSNTDKLGNTGWFDENYNGLANDFNIVSLTYQQHTDLSQPAGGATVTQLDYQNNIKVTAVIDRVTNISGQTKYQFGFAWIPLEDDDFKQNEYPFYKNLLMNTGGQIDTFQDAFNVSNAYAYTPSSAITKSFGYSATANTMDVQWLRVQQTGPEQVTFEATFEPNSGFAAMMDALDETERNYVLWISIADQSQVTNFSNRVSLLLDYNQMDTYIVPVGPYPGMTIDFLDHTQDENSVASTCGNDIRIEDGLLSRVLFTIDEAISATIPIPTALSYGFIMERISDGLTYELENFQIDLTQYPDPTQFNFNASRGFKLVAGDDKNFIKVDYWAPLDTGLTVKGVRGLYGYKVRWEDWIKRINVPAEIEQDFYNNAELNNGINNDWYQWLSNAGYTLSFVVYTDAILNGQTVRYINTKPLPFVDYDANADISTVVSYYRDSDNTLLIGGTDPIYGGPLGVILSDDIVRIEIEYTRTTGTWTSLANIYGINSISVDGGAGMLEYRQLSSIVLPEVGNPLLPLAGGTLLDVVIVSPTVIKCSCLVDPNKLINASRYRITGREGCK
jgi:hypothetical protein